MDTSEQNNFEAHWRKAFDDASETPPPSVWSRIEERLDDEEEERVVVLPLWRRWQGVQWAAAASAALLVLSLGGWWLSKNASTEQEHVAQNQAQTVPQKTEEMTDLKPTDTFKEKAPEQKGKAPEQKIVSAPPTKQPDILESKNKTPDKNKAGEVSTREFIAKAENSTGSKNNSLTDAVKTKVPKEQPASFADEKSRIAQNKTAITRVSPASEKANTSPKEIATTENLITDQLNISTPTTLSKPLLEINALEGKNRRDLPGLSKKQPWVAFQSPENQINETKKASAKEYWASVGVMPASYNAGVAIGGSTAGRAFATAGQNALANTTRSTNASTNRSALSYALQWQGGVQLNQHWSLETGINYLQGNSVFEGTNGFNVYSNSYVNNLEAAVNLSDNFTKQYDFVGATPDKSQIQSFATSQNIANSYQYLQVPVQAGYALVKPKRKLSLWLLGGLINNIFLRNSFESGQDRVVTVSGADNPYKILSLSASTGLRVQYKMSKRWTTLISGNYQRSLGSNTRSDALFIAKPQLFGVGAGLRYGF